LRDDLPVTMYLRHLPHWRQDGATYVVTYRLGDSLPQNQLNYLRRLREDWERRFPEPRTKEQWQALTRESTRWIDHWLDQGMGSCCLRDPRAAKLVADSLHHFDAPDVGRTSGPSETRTDVRYELGCYVIMPNHVHVVVRPLAPESHPLEKILQAWKTFTGREINALFHQTGTLWRPESYDRIIRDEEHLWRTIQYIGENPHKPGLSPHEYRLWIRPSWQELGWNFLPRTAS
jgi:REP element-mobilizing transposase RayT